MNAEEIRFFDDIAGRWDSMEIQSLPPKVNSLLDRIGVEAGMDVLDLGTGTGVLIPYFLERVGTDGSITAVDISKGMLAVAREKFGDRADGRLRIVKKDFEKEPIEGIYDLIMLYCVYPHLSEPEKTLGKLAGANLKQGGRIIIAFPTTEDYINSIHRERKIESGLLPSASGLAGILRQVGFDACEIPSDGYIVEIKRRSL